MRHLLCSIGIVSSLLAGTATAAIPADFEDLLEERWFEIEIVVFERLNVLDANSTETLALNGARSWPVNLMEINTQAELEAIQAARETLQEDSPERFDANVLFGDETYCFGFPTDFYEEPVSGLTSLLERTTDTTNQPTTAPTVEDDSAAMAVDEAINVEPLPEQSAPEFTVSPEQQFLTDVAEFEQLLRGTSYSWIDDLTMVTEVKALNRQRNLRPLIHRRWRQSVPKRSAPQPVYIASEVNESAPSTTAGLAKIEGFISVTVGRYLHFASTLWFHADTLGLIPIAFPVRVPLTPLPTDNYMQLQESRRMRSEEWHYLDHPKFGVIVRIDPITVPSELLETHTSLIERGNNSLQ